MIDVPKNLKDKYGQLLTQRGIPPHSHNFYQKWLRFYFDFCHKYNHDLFNADSLALFIKKLNEKNQTFRQQSLALKSEK